VAVFILPRLLWLINSKNKILKTKEKKPKKQWSENQGTSGRLFHPAYSLHWLARLESLKVGAGANKCPFFLFSKTDHGFVLNLLLSPRSRKKSHGLQSRWAAGTERENPRREV